MVLGWRPAPETRPARPPRGPFGASRPCDHLPDLAPGASPACSRLTRATARAIRRRTRGPRPQLRPRKAILDARLPARDERRLIRGGVAGVSSAPGSPLPLAPGARRSCPPRRRPLPSPAPPAQARRPPPARRPPAAAARDPTTRGSGFLTMRARSQAQGGGVARVGCAWGEGGQAFGRGRMAAARRPGSGVVTSCTEGGVGGGFGGRRQEGRPPGVGGYPRPAGARQSLAAGAARWRRAGRRGVAALAGAAQTAAAKVGSYCYQRGGSKPDQGGEPCRSQAGGPARRRAGLGERDRSNAPFQSSSVSSSSSLSSSSSSSSNSSYLEPSGQGAHVCMGGA
jgi:hypothetical protein